MGSRRRHHVSFVKNHGRRVGQIQRSHPLHRHHQYKPLPPYVVYLRAILKPNIIILRGRVKCTFCMCILSARFFTCLSKSDRKTNQRHSLPVWMFSGLKDVKVERFYALIWCEIRKKPKWTVGRARSVIRGYGWQIHGLFSFSNSFILTVVQHEITKINFQFRRV